VRKVLLAVLLVGCGQADTERRGDEAYGRGRYGEALATYRSLSAEESEPRVLAKVGAAALRAGQLREAMDAYLRLAGEDPTRGREAAAGLQGVVAAAERSGAGDVLQDAVLGLQTIAPDAVPGRFALVLAHNEGAEPEELV
jgi:hypothetical protein